MRAIQLEVETVETGTWIYMASLMNSVFGNGMGGVANQKDEKVLRNLWWVGRWVGDVGAPVDLPLWGCVADGWMGVILMLLFDFCV